MKDTLDQYWVGEKEQDFSKKFRAEHIVEGVDYTVDGDSEKKTGQEE